jgi:hypothetical protein
MDILEKNLLKELKYGSKKAYEYVFKTYYVALCRYASVILKDSASGRRCSNKPLRNNLG